MRKMFFVLVSLLLVGLVFSGCQKTGEAAFGEGLEGADSDTSHEVVCQCRCGNDGGSEDVSFEPEEGQSCESYNDVKCQKEDESWGKLYNCKKGIVPK